MAELEHRRADMERRHAKEGADRAERYTHRQRRLDIVFLPVHRDQDRASSHEVWAEQMRLRIASLKKAA
jgi:predicted GIY-YIG superfamily endonuclease